MSEQPVEAYEGGEESPEQAEERQRLRQIFDDIDSKQLEVLDAAGKSVIERVATLLAVLLAVSSFGGNFPPAYLKGNILDKSLVVAILGCYIVAMGMGMLAIQPRRYGLYRHNVTRMRKELDHMFAYKKFCVQASGIFFALGTLALVWLVVSVVVTF